MVNELVVAMLSCARIGAVHSIVFGGYSAESLASRIEDGGCKVLVTADGVWRGPKVRHSDLQGSAKRRSPGLVNFVTALAYHFCLALPAAFSQPGGPIFALRNIEL